MSLVRISIFYLKYLLFNIPKSQLSSILNKLTRRIIRRLHRNLRDIIYHKSKNL